MPSSLFARICPCGKRRVDSGDDSQTSMFLAATVSSSIAWTDGSSLMPPPDSTTNSLSPTRNAKETMDVLESPASVSTCASERHLPVDLSSQLSSCISVGTPQSSLSESPSHHSLCESEIPELDSDAPLSTPTMAGTSTVQMQLKGIPDLPEALEEQKYEDTEANFDPGEVVLGPDFHFRKYSQRSVRWLPAVKVQWQERHRQWYIVASSSPNETPEMAELNALETDVRPCVDDEPEIRRIVGTVLKQGTVVQYRVVSGQLLCEVALRFTGDLHGAKGMPHDSSNGRLLVPLDQVLSEMQSLHLRRRNIKLEAYQRQICSTMMAAQRRRRLGIGA